MLIHVLDSTLFKDEDGLLYEILDRNEKGAIDALVLIGINSNRESISSNLEDLRIATQCVFGNRMDIFLDRPSVLDFTLGLRGIPQYEIWTHDSGPREMTVDSELFDLLKLLKESVENYRTDTQKYNLSKLSQYFRHSKTSMSTSIEFFERQYGIFNRLMESIFCTGGIGSSNELLLSLSNDVGITRLDEFKLIVDFCSRVLPSLKKNSPAIAEQLCKILNVYSLAHAARNDGFELPSQDQAASTYLWLAAFLTIYAKGRLAEHQSFPAFLATFRVFELISYALLLHFSRLEFRRSSNEVFLTLNINRVSGFGPAWSELKSGVLKPSNICTEGKLKELDLFIKLRNSLVLVHGLRYVNEKMTAKYLSDVLKFATDIETKLGPRVLPFKEKLERFQSVHCYDVATIAVETISKSLSIDGSLFTN